MAQASHIRTAPRTDDTILRPRLHWRNLATATPSTGNATDHVDVLIVGAGLSGIGAACHLQERCPSKSYAILEARDAIGGTWDLFRYPGIRSDSDMFTLGYRFRPWTESKAIADGPSILNYVNETASENGIDDKIRFGHKVVRVEWSSEEQTWTVESEHDGETVRMTCAFVFLCSGYFNYDKGFTPDFEGIERFEGEIIHPQHWPEDLDYAGKRVVVIGSGATAVTLVPAMAEDAEHVTMLQRSPTYIAVLPAEDPIANFVRRVLPVKAAYFLARWKNVLLQMGVYNLSRWKPDVVRKAIRWNVKRQLPPGYEVDKHFKPAYDPWDQRLCLVPDADLFKAIGKGKASVATDRIETFTENGLRLASGEELEADVIITATGLNLIGLAGLEINVDGEDVSLPEKMAYKSLMLGDVPNFVFALGYTNASWTLKADLTSEFVCRLINHMHANGYTQCAPRNNDPSVTPEPFLDLAAGYVLRALDDLPKQGSKPPWKLRQNYAHDIVTLRHGALEDGTMEFSRAPRSAAADERVPA
jgi:monooxygenase